MATANTKRNTDAHVDDLYTTPPEVTLAGIEAGVFDGVFTVYDPCNGLGGITDVLEDNQISCYTSDKVDYGIEDNIEDFLTTDYSKAIDGIGAFVFNPPFKLTYEFMEKATSLHNKVIMFNRVSFLETIKRAERITSTWGLTDIYFFAYRVGCPKGLETKAVNAVFYAWYVFDTEKYDGTTQAHWITERPEV